MPVLKKIYHPEQIFNDSNQNDEGDIYLLINLINYLRPEKSKDYPDANSKLENLVGYLIQFEDKSVLLKNNLSKLFAQLNYRNIFTEADMLLESVFWGELFDRIVLKVLPEKYDEDSIENLIRRSGVRNKDINWILHLDNILLEKLIRIITSKSIYEINSNDNFMNEVLDSLEILNFRLGGHAFDVDIIRLVPDYDKFENPFTKLHHTVSLFIQEIANNSTVRTAGNVQYQNVLELINQCEIFLQKAFNNISVVGISFKAHQKLLLIDRILNRLKKILDYSIIASDIPSETKIARLLKEILLYYTGITKIGSFIDRSTQNIAKEITGNIGIKGESFITTTKKEYLNMLYSALGGGFLVAFACFIKMNMGYVSSSLFVKAVMYSLNYIWVFTAIYLMKFTLATKQPAMTASTLAKSIEKDINNNEYSSLVTLFSRLWRSQFVAFLGNVLMVIPTALAIMFLWKFLFQSNPAAMKSSTLINDLNFVYSPLILHSAIAGVFLFVSGLISGYTVNRTKFNQLSERIKNHPFLIKLFSENRRESISQYINRNIGGIVSNFWFGIFMGSTVVVGMFLGINLDIRHITFAAGNFALALFGQDFHTSAYDIYMSLLGIFLIGLINFTVSFSLSLFLALRSRGISFFMITDIVKNIWNYFTKNPFVFFYPSEKITDKTIK